jgi:hypothetical protein
LLLINVYCDEAYRLLIEIERRIGTESSSRAVYRRGLLALRDLGLPVEGAGALLTGSRADTGCNGGEPAWRGRRRE